MGARQTARMTTFRDAYLVESGGRRIGVVRRDGYAWRFYRLTDDWSREVFGTRADAARALEALAAKERRESS